MNTVKTLFVMPAEGMKVRQPNGSLLPKSGKEVVMNTFWYRRIKDADVTVKTNEE